MKLEFGGGKEGSNTVPALKLFLSEVRDGMTPHNWWPHDEVGHTDEAKKEMIGLYGAQNVFDTPKPERLIKRIIEIATNPNDLVLDSFACSGTTGAVAQKMGRRWIMVELGDHCETHIVPRLKKVIDGEDQGGISKAVNWQGGGAFRYFRLAPSLLKKDTWGNWIINKAYNAEMLSEAMCKHMGFQYAPSQAHFWMHGPAYFEWEPNDEGGSDEEDFELLARMGVSADFLKGPKDKAAYAKFLETYKKD